MAEGIKPPISPTVAAVFDRFIEKLNGGGVDSAVVERLRSALEFQELDAASLRTATFGAATEPK